MARLLSEPQRFELATAIRVAEAEGWPVEIVSDASTTLAPTAMTRVEMREGVIRFHVTTAGLVGAFGALPPSYTQAILEEDRRRSRSLRAFLDIFGAPLFRLMLEATEKYRLPRLLRFRALGRANRIVSTLLSLAGLRSEALRARNPVRDDAVLRYAGFFANRTRNASALGAMLADHLRLPVAIEQFVPRWVAVDPSEQTALGGSARLGVDTMAGSQIRDHAGGFRVVVGPVTYADYLSLEPGSPRLLDLMALARLYAGAALRFDVQVVLRKEDVPFCRLGDPVHQPRLGWNAWARVAPAAQDSRDAIVRAPMAA
ncbi:MAG: type VI secretion system baseplate subunit TssG [Mesorhizobium amorphae]|nr:MAG: type VI secretion system baseplate subunit TssG [Mesorhizobium amorphae]